MFKKLNNAFGRLLDSRRVSLPERWPVQGGLVIRRANHPDITAIDEEFQQGGAVGELVVSGLRSAVGGEPARDGFRQKRKLTRAERSAGRRRTEDGGLLLRLSKEGKEHDRKKAVALVEGWWGILDDGQPVPFSPEAFEALIDYKLPSGQVPTLMRETPDGDEIEYGGQSWDQALIAFVLDEAEDLEAFRADYEEGAEGNSVPSPAGTPSTSKGSKPASEGPSETA